jgi:uncharacterized protein YfbU (UPF0304 family)
MKLDQYQRQVLINQISIRRAVADENRLEISYEDQLEILRCGYESLYFLAFEGCLDRHVVAEEEGRLVRDVLDIYGAIESFRRDHPEEFKPLEDEPWSRFRGFDGDDEPGHVDLARFFVEKLGQWPELRPLLTTTDRFDSHMPTLDVYRRMILVYERLLGTDGERKLAGIKALIDAAKLSQQQPTIGN